MNDALRPLGKRMRPSEEIVRAALRPGDASVFLDGLSHHHLQMVLAQAWIDGAAQGRAIERDRALATQQAVEGVAICLKDGSTEYVSPAVWDWIQGWADPDTREPLYAAPDASQDQGE